MLFKENVTVNNLWVREVVITKGKIQEVAGRAQHSLSLRLGGNVWFETDGKQHASTENSITFMPAGVNYRTQIKESGSMIVAHFNTIEPTPHAKPLFLENRSDLKPLFAELCRKSSLGDEQHYQSLSLFYTVLGTLCKQPKQVPPRVQNIKRILDTHFSEPISITALAREAGISDVHFRNEFKQHYGVTPLGYLKQVRIENAKRLLQSGCYTVTDVALACGFDSISYFSYEFKRATGVPPTGYWKT